MRKLGVGVVGVGEMGRRHAENLRRLVPQARLVAVADVCCRTRTSGSHGTRDRELLRQPGGHAGVQRARRCCHRDADKFHADAVKAIAAAGKDMLCEKPHCAHSGGRTRVAGGRIPGGVRMQVGLCGATTGLCRGHEAHRGWRNRHSGHIQSIGRDKDGPPLSAYQSNVNGMLFYTNTIHDVDLVSLDECRMRSPRSMRTPPCLHSAGGCRVRGRGRCCRQLEIRQGRDRQYQNRTRKRSTDTTLRTEIIGSKGSILVGSLYKNPGYSSGRAGSTQPIADYFLSTFADAYLARIRDFVDTMWRTGLPRVVGGKTGSRPWRLR